MRVLVADDHALFRDGIISLLQATGFTVVGQVGNGLAAIEEALRLRPDLVLMDICMPKVNGLEALRQIKAQLPKTQVVMLTVSEDNADLLEAVRSGARGYLLKDLNAQDFLEILKGLEHGEVAVTRKTVARLINGFLEPSQVYPELAEQLTTRQKEILQLVAQGLSNKAIAHQLEVSENTVKYHIKNILQKLHAKNRTEAVTHAIRAGLIELAQPE